MNELTGIPTEIGLLTNLSEGISLRLGKWLFLSFYQHVFQHKYTLKILTDCNKIIGSIRTEDGLCIDRTELNVGKHLLTNIRVL